MTAFAGTAKLVEELVNYDGPQLLLLLTDRKRHMFAMAVSKDNMDEAFFGCEVTDKVFDQYFDEKADLHFVFSRAIGKTFYFFDYEKLDNKKVKLAKAKDEEAEDPAYWPDVGFFARSHTTNYNKKHVASSVRTFAIDGKWGANDFSIFHGKMADLYALFGVLTRLSGAHSATEKGFLRKSIQERFWQGGGSYFGFYESLLERNKLLQLSTLEVARIKYASPGELALRGDKQVLSDLSDIITVFKDNADEITWNYKNLHTLLRKESLLSAEPDAKFSATTARELSLKLAHTLADQMQIDNVDQIYDACERNTLVFSKVILSIYRRANEVYKFHAEGRVQRSD